MKIITCDQCIFGVTDNDGMLRCHRYPPQFYTHYWEERQYESKGQYEKCDFPEIESAYWCGEAKQKDV